ncbi:MAG TPA: cyclic nucleotide-binding domain-containing protein, partial [Candidatus Omnitrophota bacterium]|nr:cyclic nucleotide-binding domain-containing protein [Candidatus Omnitrophota bacterium]
MAPIPILFKKHNLIKDVPIFSALSWFDIQRISAKAKLINYTKGECIYQRGDPADGFYCLISGRVQAYILDANGNKKDVEFFRRGMYFGIISSLTGKPHSMTFETLNDSTILRIPYDDFHAILKTIPQIALAFSQSLSQRLQARSSQRVEGASSIISVYGAARGAGSSTYAFHLAVSLKAQTSKDVLLVTV